jgi:hypothetical protein
MLPPIPHNEVTPEVTPGGEDVVMVGLAVRVDSQLAALAIEGATCC